MAAVALAHGCAEGDDAPVPGFVSDTPDGGQLWVAACDCTATSVVFRFTSQMYCSTNANVFPSAASRDAYDIIRDLEGTTASCNCSYDRASVAECSCEEAPAAGDSRGWRARCDSWLAGAEGKYERRGR